MMMAARPDPQPAAPGRPKDMEKRAAVLEAAMALFPARGYDGVSMDAIAQAAGVSKLTVYSHFQDKDTLFVEAVKAVCEDMLPAELFLARFEGPLRGQLHDLHQLQEGLPAAVLADHGLGIVRHLAVQDGERRDGASGLVEPQRHLERHPPAEGVAQQVDGPRGANLAERAEVVLRGRLDGGVGRRLPVQPARLHDLAPAATPAR